MPRADHRPSEPTGWPVLPETIGGHLTAMEFEVDGRPWRVALLPLSPIEGAIAFDHYDFRFVDAAPDLAVRSHSVFVVQDAAGTRFGADLHLVYERPADDFTHWIQVVSPSSGPAFVDNGGRANPFYPYGGRTSVEGRLVVNFQGLLEAVFRPGPLRVSAETFLVRDTGRHGVVEVYPGVRWGFTAGPTAPAR